MRVPGYYLNAQIVATLLALVSTQLHAQNRCDPNLPGLTIYGSIAEPIHLEFDNISRRESAEVRAGDHQGRESVFGGVTLSSVLELAGVPAGKSLRGEANQIFLRIEAKDGYAAVLALAEADTSFRRQVPILAIRMNGTPLDSVTGPLQLIVPDDKRHGRWVRQVVCIRIASAADLGNIEDGN